jgi:hypothetical protein
MVDRVAHGPSRIPIPLSKSSPKVIHNGKYEKDAVEEVFTDESRSQSTNGCENGEGKEKRTGYDSPKSSSKVPKPSVPKDLLIEKGKSSKKPPEKGYETFLMTGDMIIKTNPSLKQRNLDCSGLERHHSDSSPYEQNMEKKTFKRSASSPDQTGFTGAKVIVNDNITMDNISKALQDDDEGSMNRKESAESGFEEQAIHSDTGTLEKNEKLPNDPISVSDLSEVDSDDLLGNGVMVGSYSSAVCDVSAVSTPSDLRSDTSANTILVQEVEPLLKESSSSSSSTDISSTESFSGELTPDMVYERSLSDSGGMSPVYSRDVVKSLNASKSAEKIILQKHLRQKVQECQGVRASKSQEHYIGEEYSFVCIDIEDTAYSLDQIPQNADETPTADEPVKFDIKSPTKHSDMRVTDPNDDRIFMPAFVKLEKSVSGNSEELSDESDSAKDLCSDQFESVVESLEYEESDGISETDAQELTQELESVSDPGAQSKIFYATDDNETDNSEEYDRFDDYDDDEPVINQVDDLFMLPPVKSVDQPSAQRLAKRLYNLDGFRKSDVSRHLSKK